MRREEKPIARPIPMNVVDSGRCLNGLVKTRNLIEACILVSPVFLILYLAIPSDNITLKIQIMSVLVGGPFILGVIGIPPYSLFEFISLIVKFRKTNHFALYNPRLKMKTTPDFLVHATDLPLFTQLKNSFDMLFGDSTEEKREEAMLTIANCTNEIHYKDDESESEWRKNQKKAEANARKQAKRDKKAAAKAARKLQKQNAKEQKRQAKHIKKRG